MHPEKGGLNTGSEGQVGLKPIPVCWKPKWVLGQTSSVFISALFTCIDRGSCLRLWVTFCRTLCLSTSYRNMLSRLHSTPETKCLLKSQGWGKKTQQPSHARIKSLFQGAEKAGTLATCLPLPHARVWRAHPFSWELYEIGNAKSVIGMKYCPVFSRGNLILS